MKYLRRELNQVEKEYLKDAIAKNKPLEQVPEDMWRLIEF